MVAVGWRVAPGTVRWVGTRLHHCLSACLRDRAESYAVNYTPLLGLLGSGALMCGEGFLICQPPADTWLRLLPAYGEEGHGARCLHTAELWVHLNVRCKRQFAGSGGTWSLLTKPSSSTPIIFHFLAAGSSLPFPAPSSPHPQTLEKQSAAGKRGQWGKRVCACPWRCQGAWA